MYFIFTAYDKPDMLSQRMLLRSDHRQYIWAKYHAVRLIYGAPLADDGGKMNGSFLLFKAQNKEDAEQFVANDPYQKAGIFAHTSLNALHDVALTPIFKGLE